MKTKPILFSTEMVQAINEGRKTQTRRTKGLDMLNVNFSWYRYDGFATYDDQSKGNRHYFELLDLHGDPTCQYTYFDCPVKPGDIFWVRETFEKVLVQNAPVDSMVSEVVNKYIYKADGVESFIKWKPSIFMPKEACRLWLEVTNVRAERLHDISTADAIDEGIFTNNKLYKNYKVDFDQVYPVFGFKEAIKSFQTLWESINGKASLDANPWVWVYTFQKCEMPKDFLK